MNMKKYKVSAKINETKNIEISYNVEVHHPTPDIKVLEHALKSRAVVDFNDATEKLVSFKQIILEELLD